MTFEEAIAKKIEIGEKTPINSKKSMRVLVVPSDYEDFKKYMEEYATKRKIDTRAKRFSNNNAYEVYGLLIDGGNVVMKKLS